MYVPGRPRDLALHTKTDLCVHSSRNATYVCLWYRLFYTAPPPLPLPLQKGGQDAVRVNAPEHMQSVANLLGVAAKDLEVSVTNKVTFTRGELFCTPLTVDQALDTRQAEEQLEDQYSTLLEADAVPTAPLLSFLVLLLNYPCRDALSKSLYSSLFSWLVERVNHIICNADREASIAVLDIFGFENFEHNSFEQLCINFANENLQFYFNQHIFALEQVRTTHRQTCTLSIPNLA